MGGGALVSKSSGRDRRPQPRCGRGMNQTLAADGGTVIVYGGTILTRSWPRSRTCSRSYQYGIGFFPEAATNGAAE